MLKITCPRCGKAENVQTFHEITGFGTFEIRAVCNVCNAAEHHIPAPPDPRYEEFIRQGRVSAPLHADVAAKAEGEAMTEKPKRKIVQIAAAAEGNLTHQVLYALCDDGTVWNINARQDGWAKLPPIPQEDANG